MESRPIETSRAQDATKVFAAAYGSIAEKYIQPKTIRQLALEGLEGLSDADPALTFESHGDLVRLVHNGQLLRVGVAPAAQALDGWASLSADFLAVAQATDLPDAKRGQSAFMTAMFSHVLASLDSYSRYAGGRTARQQREKRKGYSGAGLKVDYLGTTFVVTKVIAKSPAEKAGIRPLDEILKINGRATADLDRDAFLDRLRGPINSTLSLSIKRSGVSTPISIALRRQQVYLPTVHYERHKTIAYFRISSFNRNTAHSLARHLARIKTEPEAPEGIVLDLRGNPGGLMDQAIAVADLFLKSGRIISTRGRHPDSSQRYNAVASDISTDLPVIILLNGKSASSAEIVAAALHDRHRALVLGSRSYGKGTVQTILPLPNGAEIILTWSHLYTPNGAALNDDGVQPDICTAGLSQADMKALAVEPGIRKPAPCPPLRTGNGLDLSLAEKLLENPEYFADLFGKAPEDIARKQARLLP